MDVMEAMLRRRSIRKYTDEPVAAGQIDQLLHAAMAAPSACNRQPWEFYVVTNEEKLAQLRTATHFSHITAPLAIVVCGSLERALPKQLTPYWIQDCSAATENILLAATAMGLGSVWCGLHPQKRGEERVAALLELSGDRIPLGLIYIGHPAQTQPPRDQYNEAYVHFVK